MVKVISMGTATTSCYKCKSILEYKYHDTREVKSYDYGGGCDIERGFDCPVCGSFVKANTTDFGKSTVPLNWR